MDLIEDVIAALAPRWALRRTLARTALEAARSYEAGRYGRRTKGWQTSGGSANMELASGMARIRNRARDLVRNNEYALSAIDGLATNTIGTGILVQPKAPAERALWERWAGSTDCDADGVYDLAGLERLIALTMYESGEALVRRRWRRAEDGYAVPMQLQVLEPDHLDESKIGVLENGNIVILGVELNRIGQRVAYWLYPDHPGEIGTIPRGLESRRVPASEVLHIYDKRRPSQLRGVSRLAASIMRLRDLADYEDAELVRKKVEACFVAFVTTSDDRATVGDLQAANDGGSATAPRSEKLAPGLIKYLKPDESVEFGNPTPTAGGGEFTRRQLQAIAVGCRMTYAQLTGDMSQSNFSSSRMGLIEFRQMMDQQQWLIFVPQLVKPVRAWFREASLMIGKESNTEGDKITMPRRHYIDPLKDVLSSKEEVRGGVKSLSEWIREQGEDPETVFAEIAAERKRLRDLEIVVDSDAEVATLKLDPGAAITATSGA